MVEVRIKSVHCAEHRYRQDQISEGKGDQITE
jgi:hypothetical protein